MAETGTPPDQPDQKNTTPAAPDAPQDADAPAKPHKRRRVKVLEAGVSVAGFSNVLKAWRAEGNRFKNVAGSLVKKFADMAAGSIVSMSFRLIAITWVAGIIGGVSTFGALGLLALATGAASSVYTYGKDFAGAKLKLPKDQRHTVKFFDRDRAKRAAIAFGTGFLSGGVGLWLAKTEIVQSILGGIRDFFKPATDVLSDPFNSAAAKPASPDAPLRLAHTPEAVPAASSLTHTAPLATAFAASQWTPTPTTAATPVLAPYTVRPLRLAA